MIDGRESLLRDCIYAAACELAAEGARLSMKAVTDRGWQLFEEQAHVGKDAPWTVADAKAKARQLLRKHREGRLDPPLLACASRALFEPAYGHDHRLPLREAERALASALRKALNDPSRHHLVRAELGLGKTRAAVEAIAVLVRASGAPRVVMCVPTHKLA